MNTTAWYELETDGATVRVDAFLIPPSIDDVVTIDRAGAAVTVLHLNAVL